MFSPLNVEQFADALNSEQGLSLPLSAAGYVRKTEDKTVIEFSPSLSLCLAWIKIPLKMIDNVQLLGKRPCRDHLHDYVILHFKQPDSPEATVFAELFCHEGSARSSQPVCGAETLSRVGLSDLAPAAIRGQFCCRVYIRSLSGGEVLGHAQTHDSFEAAVSDMNRTVSYFEFQGFHVTRKWVESGHC